MNELSKLAYGIWRLDGLTAQALYQNLVAVKGLGIDTIDTADIYHLKEYGDSERLIGEALNMDPSLKEYFKIVTKTGICLKDEDRDVKYYNNTYDYIVSSAKKSQANLGVESVYLYLLHRPSVFMDFEEVYQAFKYLKDNNIVKHFGVSNYTPIQFEALYQYLQKRGIELMTNQIELNALSTEHLDNDNIYYLKGREITPMIWSPLAGGAVFQDGEVNSMLAKLAAKYDVDIMNIAIAYVNQMGLETQIVLGSHKIERIKSVVDNIDLKLRDSEMFEILKAQTKVDIR